MSDEQPKHINHTAAINNGNPFHPLTYIRTYSIPATSITEAIGEVPSSGAECEGMEEDYYEGDEIASVGLFNKVETVRSCLACLEYITEDDFPALQEIKDSLTLKCVDIIDVVVKIIHAETVTE